MDSGVAFCGIRHLNLNVIVLCLFSSVKQQHRYFFFWNYTFQINVDQKRKVDQKLDQYHKSKLNILKIRSKDQNMDQQIKSWNKRSNVVLTDQYLDQIIKSYNNRLKVRLTDQVLDR